MPGITCRRAAKYFGEADNQYKIINFHLPPIAASAAVRGHPPTALGRARRVWALERYGEFGELERGESLLIAVRKVSGVVPCPAIQGVQVSSCGVCVHWS
jgi:hypothetical protein